MWTTKAPTAKASLFINQLPYGATREDVASYFAEAALKSASALLPSVRLVLKDGKFTGTAFVDMSDWETLDAGLALHQTVFTCADGSTRKINVREAVSKAQLELLGERAKTKEAATPEKTPAQSVVQGELGRDRKGKVVVGEVDPQRKRKALEGAYLEARRPSDQERLDAERLDATRYWSRVRGDLAEFGGERSPTWTLLDDALLLETMVTLEKIAKRMKSVLNERGAR